MPTASLDATAILQALPKNRISALGRHYSIALSDDRTKQEQIETLLATANPSIVELLRLLTREELRACCRSNELEHSGRSRQELASRVLNACGEDPGSKPGGVFDRGCQPASGPKPGDVVQVRHRQYLVEDVTAPPQPHDATLVHLVCLDDDNQGRELKVFWELELGAKVMRPEAEGLGAISKIDPPRHFAAYLHALKWNSVTAADPELFQSPFRAGIKLLNHQLIPLKKALSLPRVNLFIADDVGLGKTIEAGLVLSELILRQQVNFVVIVCPASICLQWRDEMDKRFGLSFEIYNRHFVTRRREERGFQVNPWGTHNRFIISYNTLRRPEYRDPLLHHLGPRARKSLLILDEAHTVAPASPSRYAIDSKLTHMARDFAPRFEHRLFLSATPHNGHSNSFSALLEILDPRRFTRGVPITGPEQLEPVMVRRLKSDLREIGVEGYPERRLIQLDLTHDDQRWIVGLDGENSVALAEQPPVELELATKLREYSEIMKPKKGRGRLVFINLQKRLLSSVEAFWRTLNVHARTMRDHLPISAGTHYIRAESDDDEYGLDEDTVGMIDDAQDEASSREVAPPELQARQLLDELLQSAGQYRLLPDAKAHALLHWIKENQCQWVAFGGAQAPSRKQSRAEWSDRRVIVFTEYADTKRWLVSLLNAAFEGTHLGDRRLMQFHGGMSDEQRDEVQKAFNSHPDDHPVRVLVATDAAREGVNLQGHCADLFHFDIPWNPSRMEQRNGRIDRTLQPSPIVCCYYFFLTQRHEDLVLQKVVKKVETINEELGSLGSVVMARLGKALDPGIDANTDEKIDRQSVVSDREEKAAATLEFQRKRKEVLRQDLEVAGKLLNKSRGIMEFDPDLLTDAMNVGFELSDLPQLSALDGASVVRDVENAYAVGELPSSWQETLDTLRPPRARDEAFWEWRKKPPQPVTFKPPKQLTSGTVQLHLQHSLVRRLLSRFLAQGFSSHDLARVTIVRNPYDSLVRVIAFGRLSLFGRGATRLHDQLVSVAARWIDGGGEAHLRPFAEEADRRALERLEELFAHCPNLDDIGANTQEKLRQSAPQDFANLWNHVKEEADHLAHDAGRRLKERGEEEAENLRRILENQRSLIRETISEGEAAQSLDLVDEALRQFEREREYMEQRLGSIDKELVTEPEEIRDLYQVILPRLEPVGLVYLWPETRA